MEEILRKILAGNEIRVLIDGPPLSGKTNIVKAALEHSGKNYAVLTTLTLFSNPSISPSAIIEDCMRKGAILFFDQADSVFPSEDTDFHLLFLTLKRRPKMICTCRDRTKCHPFLLRYITHMFTLEPPPSKRLSSGIPSVSFSDIGGNERAKESIKLIGVWCVENARRIKEFGIKPPSGLILYGPPGTGKTLLAKAAATACNCKFYSIAIPDLLRCEVGESEKRLVELFEQSRADSPSIVFIDEIQALFGKRLSHKTDSNRLVLALIQQLDLGGVFCIAATNVIEAVDPTLLQPGRFEEKIEVGLPNAAEREQVLRIALSKVHTEESIDFARLSEICDGFSPSEICGMCNKAAMNAAILGKELITEKDIASEFQSAIIKRV